MDARDRHGANWRKSSHSGDSGCVQTAATRDGIAIRDSKDPNGPRLVFEHGAWTTFIGGVKTDDFELS